MDKLLLEYPWISKVVSLSKEHGLNWLLMTALALELSKGDPRCRTLDSKFLMEHMGPDCPLSAHDWVDGVPNVTLFDLSTRWGLFQILGRVVIDKGIFTGRLINFIDTGANAKAACVIAADIFKNNGTEDDVIRYFGCNPLKIRNIMEESRKSMNILLHINMEEVIEE